MPSIDDMKVSKFLKKSDLGDDEQAVYTIAGVSEENVGNDDKPDVKWVLLFKDQSKPMVLNWTNMQLAAMIFGSRETDSWTGKRITVWHDPSVQFKGEMKGGLRLRKAPGAGQAPTEDVPF